MSRAPTNIPVSRLRLLPLVAATFFMVAGGPYGLEDLVQKAGYAWALVVLLILPFLWSLPTALMVGELSSALPEEGGYYAWVRRALGPFLGFQEAWLSLLASVFDMAIYPTLFVLYLGQLAPALGSGRAAVAIGAAVIGAAAIWNIAGVRAVGDGSTVMMIALLLPFAALTVYALWRPVASMTVHHTVSADFLGALAVGMWNYMGWDNASTIAGEVENPQRNYPRAMLWATLLVAATYLIPVGAAALAGIDPSSWSTGAWVEAAGALGGRWLALTVVAGGMMCGIGMTNALVLSYTRVPYAMARDGYLPRVFTRLHPRTGAPWVCIIACAVAWCLCLPLGFERLVLIDILLYGGSLLLEFIALIVLRVREPQLARPFRAPAAALLGIGPTALLALTFVRGYRESEGPASALMLAAGLAALGVGAYFVAKWRSARAGALADEGVVR